MGGCERDIELLGYLSRTFTLRVVYLGKICAPDKEAIRKLCLGYTVHDIGLDGALSDLDWAARFRNDPVASEPADVYIIRGIENSHMLDALPTGVPRFLDTLDLVSERGQMKSDSGNVLTTMTREEEVRIFKRYSQVICIQQDEADLAAGWLGKEHVITAMHPVKPRKLVPGRDRLRIGMLASRWLPNAYGLRDFVVNCWPKIRKIGATLDVYGRVNERLRASIPGVTFHGYIEDIDECYADQGLMINPVQYGAGLKIKSIEAMSQGVPLVTSREGASGIEHLDGEALVIADNWDEFAGHVIALTNNEPRCTELVTNALAYVAQQFSEEACFTELGRKIQSC